MNSDTIATCVLEGDNCSEISPARIYVNTNESKRLKILSQIAKPEESCNNSSKKENVLIDDVNVSDEDIMHSEINQYSMLQKTNQCSSEQSTNISMLNKNNAPFLDMPNTTSHPMSNNTNCFQNKKSVIKDLRTDSVNGSLKDRLKNKLITNAAIANIPLEETDEKKSILQKACIEASQIRKNGREEDIGPFFGLPARVQQLFENYHGIKQLYDWQVECLQLDAVRDGKNLIYKLPTSGGKTLVAQVLILKELLCYQKDSMLILPFISIVKEKVQVFSEFGADLNFIVEEYAGNKGKFPPIKRQKKKSLYIATIEKAHSLINSLIETNRMDCLGLVVVDELHMIGEGNSRGATLESTLLKILTVKCSTQIIGMSATLNNLNDLQTFLRAEIYCSDFRPVKLQELIKLEENLFRLNASDEDSMFEHERTLTFPYSKEILQEDPDHLFGLVTEIVPENSCLIFCSTKKNCENVAMLISKLLCKHHRQILEGKKDQRRQLLQQLGLDGEGKICPVLEYTVHFGIAYHHSGLTMDERRLIEEAYISGVLCLLTCTSTLAAGVNVPAKRVIIRSPYVGNNFIKLNQYKQMVGRAGRAGIDTSGESILIVSNKDRHKAENLFKHPQECCHSSLFYEDGKGVKFLILSAVGLKIVTTTQEVYELMKKSLLHIQSSELSIDTDIITKEALQYLLDKKLVVQTKTVNDLSLEQTSVIQVTPLGRATFKGLTDHSICHQLYEDLNKAKESLSLTSHLHLIHLVTPYELAQKVTPDWAIYYREFCRLSEREVKAAEVIGISESYLALKMSGRNASKKMNTDILQRFYLTLMLWQLWNKRSLWEVAASFVQTRGFLQNLLAQSAAFASSVFHFCQELEDLWAFQDLLSSFVKKLAYCVTSELLPLIEIPGMRLEIAKQMYSAGLKNATILASSSAEDVKKCVPYITHRKAKIIIAAAKNVLEEKKAALLEEIETLTVSTT